MAPDGRFRAGINSIFHPANHEDWGNVVQSRFDVRSTVLLFGVLALALGGCGSVSENLASLRTTFIDSPPAPYQYSASPEVRASAAVDRESVPAPVAAAVSPETPVDPRPAPISSAFVPVALEPLDHPSIMLTLADPADAKPEAPTATKAPASKTSDADEGDVEEYDPWERFNEKMFTFNYNLDKYVLKPVAKGYNFVVPDLFQQMIGHGFDNILVVPKLVNNILQWNWKGFMVELGRFVINSTLGIGGLFDIARQEFGLDKTKVDFGQTLGKWGVGPGPFLVLPFLPPLTVRDGIGNGVDGAMDPLGYVLPFFPDRLAMRLGNTVNERSLNLDLFQGFEETTVDLYSAVRNGYLQRRRMLIHGP